jgi:hypothetical protein
MGKTFLVVIDPDRGDARLFRAGLDESRLLPAILDAMAACGITYDALYGDTRLAVVATRLAERLMFEGRPGESARLRGYGTVTVVEEPRR